MVTLNQTAVVAWEEVAALAEVDAALEVIPLATLESFLMVMSDVSVHAVVVALDLQFEHMSELVPELNDGYATVCVVNIEVTVSRI